MENKPPVDVGQEIDVRVEAVGEKGDGIVRVKGFVLFVPGVNAGDEIRIRVSKVLSKVGFAEKIGDAKRPVPGKEKVEVAVEEPEPYIDEKYEDSEDFGEEPEEEPAEEVTDDTDDVGEEVCQNCGGPKDENHVCPK